MTSVRDDPRFFGSPAGPFMFASTFIFPAGQYDEEFHRLDQQIADVA